MGHHQKKKFYRHVRRYISEYEACSESESSCSSSGCCGRRCGCVRRCGFRRFPCGPRFCCPPQTMLNGLQLPFVRRRPIVGVVGIGGNIGGVPLL